MPADQANFVCSKCGRDFATAKEFSDHYRRAPESITITGCKAEEGKSNATPRRTRR